MLGLGPWWKWQQRVILTPYTAFCTGIAIKFDLRRPLPRGTKQGFVDAVHEHFTRKAGALVTEEDTQPPLSPSLSPACDFSSDEVLIAVHRLTPGKTAGPSGCSADFFKALCSENQGLSMLLCHLNDMLRGSPLDQQRVAELILLPKVQSISMVDQFRPIALMESIHKLYMALLIRRIQHTWGEPHYQLGGCPGSQMLSALFCATTQLEKQSLEGSQGIWISADIKSAFDSVMWCKLEQALYQFAYPELQRLLHEIKLHKVSINWEGKISHIKLDKGVLQGGTHSSQIFSITMEALFQELYARWDRDFPGKTRGWCYIDDCLLWFSPWEALHCVYPWLVERFAEYGFSFNTTKTKLCSTSLNLSAGNDWRPQLHPELQSIEWTISFKYLGLRLQVPPLYLEEGDNMTTALFKQGKVKIFAAVRALKQLLARQHHARWDTAIRLVDVFIASRWLWMSPCMHPTQTKLEEIQSIQLGIMCTILKLYVPADYGPEMRRALHRIRRRASLELLRLRCPTKQWTWCWLSRKWTFMGHLLRRPRHHKATASLLEPIRQIREGRATTAGRWLVATLKGIGFHFDNIEALHNLYWSKDEWYSCLRKVVEFHHIPNPTTLPEWKTSTWDRWSHPFTCGVTWFNSTLIYQADDRTHFKWLQHEYGWMEHTETGPWFEAIQNHCRWQVMSQAYPIFCVQLLVSVDESCDIKLGIQQAVHQLYSEISQGSELIPVILLEEIPADWVCKVCSL